jgi:small multidrug resistance family-3 protein
MDGVADYVGGALLAFRASGHGIILRVPVKIGLAVMNHLIVLGFLIVATTLEASGDAVVRIGLHNEALLPRAGLFLVGTALLFGYGLTLNLAPIEFGRVVGVYVAILLVVWQIVNFAAFRALPTMPILIGGTLVIVGGSIMAFWQRG